MTMQTFSYTLTHFGISELTEAANDFSIMAKGWVREVIGVENQKPQRDLLQDYQPRTPFGRRLLELRAKIVASGTHLLSWDEIEEEVARRRGGRGDGNRE